MAKKKYTKKGLTININIPNSKNTKQTNKNNSKKENKLNKKKEHLNKIYSKLSVQFKLLLKFSTGSIKSFFLVILYLFTILGDLMLIFMLNKKKNSKNSNRKEKSILDGGW